MCRINVESDNIENIPDPPYKFQDCTNGAFQNGLLYILNMNNELMGYKPKTQKGTDSIFKLGERANMIAHPHNKDILFFLQQSGKFVEFSISENSIIKTFAQGENYNLGLNNNIAMIPDKEDENNFFIATQNNYQSPFPQILNLKLNLGQFWNIALPNNGHSGGFLLWDGGKLGITNQNKDEFGSVIEFPK